MNKYITLSAIKFFITVGMSVGGLAAWAVGYFESKEHVLTLKESRDREYDHLDKKLDGMDHKIDILMERR